MAIILDSARLLCEYGDGRPAVAFGRWQYSDPQVLGRWRLHCRQCCKYDAVDSRELQIVYLDSHDPAAESDHPGHGHVHVRYADGVSADHPTNI